jgi:formylglycine-generating enzyme required for sulfatase activity
VTIGNSVRSIEDHAFLHCSSLTTITIPDSVSIIGAHAFNGCTSLSNIVIGNGVTSIGGGAFQYCTGLTSIKIPNSVAGIGASAFYGCLRLTAIYFEGDAPAVGKAAFSDTLAILYFMAETQGWPATLDERPTVLWNGVVGAQTIQLHGGLTIIGEIGDVFLIEYSTDLPEPAEAEWRCLEFLQLPTSPYLWVDKQAPATGTRFYRATAMETPINMVFIPPGTFRMGSPDNEEGRFAPYEGPQREVIISRGFWIGKCEVTQGEYEAVMGVNPSWYNGDRTIEAGIDFGTDPTRPVEQVSWSDAVAYCVRRTQSERDAGTLPAGSGYRLPTEAEWEYACRAWTSTRFSYGDDPHYSGFDNYAWCYFPDQRPHPVGQKLPNPWGLYDMHGNVSEWCQDWFGEYRGEIAVDPQGPQMDSSRNRILRGGDCNSSPQDCRSASRNVSFPESRWRSIGFRVVLAPSQP